jgi:hypothetical protein
MVRGQVTRLKKALKYLQQFKTLRGSLESKD